MKRAYEDPCGVARALDRVGERWALLIVRELLFGAKRFVDLRACLAGVSPNVLTQRLGELEEDGVLLRRQLEPPSNAWVYELSPRGRELEETLLALGRWGSRAPAKPGGELSFDAFLLALRTTFTKAADMVVELRAGRDVAQARVEDGRLEIARGAAAAPIAVLDADVATLRRLVFGDITLEAARASGALRLEGSRPAAARFLAAFVRPRVAVQKAERS